jgi:hypothetical protein
MNSQLLFLLMFVFVSQRIKPSPFTSSWGGSVSVELIFQIMLGSKKNSHNFFSSIESTLILTFRIIDLQIYTPLTNSNPEWKKVLHASKLIKLFEKHIYKELILFLCIVYSMPATFVINRCSSRRL